MLPSVGRLKTNTQKSAFVVAESNIGLGLGDFLPRHRTKLLPIWETITITINPHQHKFNNRMLQPKHELFKAERANTVLYT